MESEGGMDGKPRVMATWLVEKRYARFTVVKDWTAST